MCEYLERFVDITPDEQYLFPKVICLMGVAFQL